MTDARIILWFTWFVAANWLRAAITRIRDRAVTGICSTPNSVSIFLMLLIVATAFH